MDSIFFGLVVEETMARIKSNIAFGTALAASGLAFQITMTPDPALAGTPKTEEKPAWAQVCLKDKAKKVVGCRLVQRILVKKGDKRALLIAVQLRYPKAGKPYAFIRLPHGLALPAGIELAVMSEKAKEPKIALRAPVQSCNREGCIATLPLEDKLLAQMRTGKNLRVSFVNLKKKTISVALTLKGFTKAYEKLNEMLK